MKRIASTAAILFIVCRLHAQSTGTFALTGSMRTARQWHTATLLHDGTVLIAGGCNSSPLSSTEIYDPMTRTFRVTAAMREPRCGHTATLLADGRVLLAGGNTVSAELYDPATRTFTRTGDMLESQGGHSATRLVNGKVLIAGGLLSQAGVIAARAELYDPDTGLFAFAAPYADTETSYSRGPSWATATLLPDGRVLLIGNNPPQTYDPRTDQFELTAPMVAARYRDDLWFYWHAAVSLKNGSVLIIGGNDEWDCPGIPESDLYDPAIGSFVDSGDMHHGRMGHTATLLIDGRVLVTGGGAGWCFMPTSATAELYEPAARSFAVTASMVVPRVFHTATLLNDGTVLIAGGEAWWQTQAGSGCEHGMCVIRAAELYRPDATAPPRRRSVH